MATKKHVLFLIFPYFNTLDLNGPQEVLKNFALGAGQEEQMFDVAVAVDENTTTAFERVHVERDISFEEALESISKFDILMVAGGPPADVEAAIIRAKAEETKMLDLISAFAKRDTDQSRQRWLVSICSGVGFLASCGILGGKTVTSHFGYLGKLEQLCKDNNSSGQMTTVVRKRWVDGGSLDSGVRLATSGGVSCGIDCTLWLISEIGGTKGMEMANSVAVTMDYDWKYHPNSTITSGWIV